MATDHEKKKYDKSLGIDATVKRETFGGSEPTEMNRRLREIGAKSNPNEAYAYVGSAAFHVYVAEGSGVMTVVSQVQTMQDCRELIAITALQNFSGDLIQFYGHKRPGALRSGF